MPQRKIAINKDRPAAIAVEGADCFHFLLSRIENHSEFDNVWLYDFGGITDLKTWLGLFTKLADYSRVIKSIGVICDAEESMQARKNSIVGALRECGLPGSKRPYADGGREASGWLSDYATWTPIRLS